MKTMKTLSFLAVLMLFACATSQTAYAPAGDSSEAGYYSTKISDDRYRVGFNGNAATSENTVKDYTLLRAAELTLQEGGSWFQVVERSSNKEVSQRSTPRTEISRTQVIERDCGLLGCQTRSRPVMTTTVGVDSGPSRSSYSSSLEILVGSGEMPQGDGQYYDAKQLASTLRKAM